MSLQQSLFDIDALQSFCDLSTFTQNIPVEWVDSALQLSSQATIRRRRLPADQVLWLVLGMALFRNEPVSEVAAGSISVLRGSRTIACWPQAGYQRRDSVLVLTPFSGYFNVPGCTGDMSVTPKMNGEDCKFSLSMARCCAPKILLSCEIILAPVTRAQTGKLRTLLCAWLL